MIFASLSTLLGALLRRFWGGWEQDQVHIEWHFVKIGIVAAVGILIGLFSLHYAHSALLFGVVLLLMFLNPFHSKGQGMGKVPGTSLIKSVFWMSSSYGVLTAISGLVLCLSDKNPINLLYCPTGFLASAGYLLGWYVLPKLFGGITQDGKYNKQLKLFGGTIIDSPTSIGELVLGSLLVGALPWILQVG